MQKLLLLSLFSILFTANLSAKTIRYVKTDGTGDGSSWANASSSIQTMIDNSSTGDEVWVAKGTYFPTTETIARDARSRTFLVKSGVNIRGGFAGSETTLTQRQLADLDANGKIDSCELVNKTILSGDIDGATDVWIKTTNTDGTWKWTIAGNNGNCYRVVTGEYRTTIEGFTVIGGNANNSTINSGGGIYSTSLSYVINCTVSNCSASNGGGIYFSYYVANCTVSGCYASNGGGIYSSSENPISSNVTNCTVSNCSASNGGGIYSFSSTSSSKFYYSYVMNSTVSNCFASNGGGIYSSSSYVTNCTVSNCSASNGGGISSVSSFLANCTVSNCSASNDGGIYGDSYYCAVSNNKNGDTIGSGISGGTNCISPNISDAYIQPTSFIGLATTDAQKAELLTANWRLKESSPCINAGVFGSASATSGSKDIDGNTRVLYGSIDIGAYEYVVPNMAMPVCENFNNLSDWNSSLVFYKSAQLNGLKNIKWNINSQKAVFSWQTNLTTSYSEQFFTYQIDATNSTQVYLSYNMYFEAYVGSISPLGTEQLNVEYSTDFVTWSTVASYSNAKGTITNQTYKHDLSTQLAGRNFFIRFRANGQNTNRIEKWEIDNVNLYTDGLSGVNTLNSDKYIYIVTEGTLKLSGLQCKEHIALYDITGKIISTKTANSDNLSIKLPCVGVYIVSINSNGVISNKRIIY